MIINGCQDGKHTPRLSEVKCPKCGEYVDVFVVMSSNKTGTLYTDEKCSCGHILPAGSYESEYEK